MDGVTVVVGVDGAGVDATELTGESFVSVATEAGVAVLSPANWRALAIDSLTNDLIASRSASAREDSNMNTKLLGSGGLVTIFSLIFLSVAGDCI